MISVFHEKTGKEGEIVLVIVLAHGPPLLT